MVKTEQRLNPNFTYLQSNVPKERWTLLQGGTRSGKTYSACQYIIKLCLECPDMGLEIDIVRSTLKALKSTVWKDFYQLLVEYGLYDVNNHNKTDGQYKLKGNVISYYGADDPAKVHGRKRDILYLNEVNQIDEETIDQFTVRTKKRIIADYNPAIGDDHWLDQYIKKYPPLITTYRDNPFLSKEQIEDIESKKHQKYWWTVYGNGERAKREGVIFTNWKEGKFDTSLPYYYGLDFGFKKDPDACIKVAIDESRSIIYLDEVFYEHGQTIDELSILVKDLDNAQIIADSAESRLINYLRTKTQKSIREVKKGAGSVMQGVKLMENYQLIVTPNSHNVIKELNNYAWATKGKEAPIDDFNHAIDAIRYVVFTYSNNSFKRAKNYENKNTKFVKGDFVGGMSSPWVGGDSSTKGDSIF